MTFLSPLLPIPLYLSPCVSLLVGIALLIFLVPIYRATQHVSLVVLLCSAWLEIIGAAANLVYNYVVSPVGSRTFTLPETGWLQVYRHALAGDRCLTVVLYAVGTIQLAQAFLKLGHARRS